MKAKMITRIVLVAMLMAGIIADLSLVDANGGKEVLTFQDSWTATEIYAIGTWHEGFAKHYGVDEVAIHYRVNEKWTLVRWKIGENTWKVRQTMSQKGEVDVYIDNVLVDTFPYRCVEYTVGEVEYLDDYYYEWDFKFVEFWSYYWQVDGLYRFWGGAHSSSSFWENTCYMYWAKAVGLFYADPTTPYPHWVKII
jgi:hypothetical protein